MGDEERDTGLRHRNPVPAPEQPPAVSVQPVPEFRGLPEHRESSVPDEEQMKSRDRFRRSALVGMGAFLFITYAMYCVWIYRMSSVEGRGPRKESIEMTYPDGELHPYSSMTHFRNSAGACRKTFGEERERGSFLTISNLTHMVWTNMSSLPESHERMLAKAKDLTEFVCSSMVLSGDATPPCACTISRRDGKDYFTFLDPHVIRVSSDMADIEMIEPLVGVTQPVRRKIPWGVEFEYYPIVSGSIMPMERLYLEGPEVCTLMHAISFMNERT